jgi:hypothetical protein
VVVAEHALALGTRVRRVDPAHLAGISGHALPPGGPARPLAALPEPSLLRPLAEYAALVEELAA